MEEQQFYGEDRVVQIMQDEGHGWLFYVSHNTRELFDEFLEYCADSHLDPTEENSACRFMHHRNELFEESL